MFLVLNINDVLDVMCKNCYRLLFFESVMGIILILMFLVFESSVFKEDVNVGICGLFCEILVMFSDWFLGNGFL